MNATFLTLAVLWIGAPADETPQTPIAVAETARSEEKRPKQELPWGEPVEGVRCRLHVEKATLKAGQWPRLFVDVKNGGDRELTLGEAPDFWELECDGTWYRAGVLFSGDIKILELSPPNTSHGFPLLFAEKWKWKAKDGGRPLVLGAGKHVLRVAIQPAPKQGGPWPRVVSNLVEIRIVPLIKEELPPRELPWGKPVEGVQCRLRPQQTTWTAGQTPHLQADLRNQGERQLSMRLYPTSWKVEYDGVWYHATAWSSGGVELLRLKPGDQRDGISLLLEDRFRWMSGDGRHRLVFRPGRHKLRVSFLLHTKDGSNLTVVSDAVEIEIVADQPAADGEATAWGEAVEGLQCRLRPEKVTWTLSELKQPGGAVRCKIDFRSRSGAAWSYLHSPLASQHVEWDGKWHRMTRMIPATSRLLLAGEVVRDVDCSVGTGVVWTADDSSDQSKADLSIGWHTIRTAILFSSGDRQVKVVSNPVEIEIVAGKRGSAAFGPVIERVVTEQPSKATTYLDLDTGKHVAPEPDAFTVSIGWLREHGVDLRSSELESEPGLRTAVDMVLGQLSDTAFGESGDWTADEARRTIVRNLEGRDPSPGRVIAAPGAYAFRTREGNFGVMQLLTVPGNSSEISVHYRLLKEPGHLRVDQAAEPRPPVSESKTPAKEKPPRARPETGPRRGTFLFIRTVPSGADVLVDGRRVGATDDLFPLDPGVRRIVVELDGHDPDGRTLTVRAGRIERMKFVFKKRGKPSIKEQVHAAGADDGQPAVGAIVGKVVDAEGAPVRDAFVVLCDQATGVPIAGKALRPITGEILAGRVYTMDFLQRWTDPQGRFRFEEIPAGRYRLIAQSCPSARPKDSFDKVMDRELHLRGIAEDVLVSKGSSPDVVIRPLGTGVLRIEDNLKVKDGVLVAISTAPTRADPALRFVGWGGNFAGHMVGGIRKLRGPLTVSGLPEGKIHVALCGFVVDDQSGWGTGEAVVKAQQTTDISVLIDSTWAGRREPPERLQPLFETVKSHGADKFINQMLQRNQMKISLTMNSMQDAWQRDREISRHLDREVELPTGGTATFGDVMAVMQYIRTAELRKR